ncbi:MAG: bifunctional phosphoribosyl-AMP cyclohydrolase/phosphoribosyl-ATP diphosphatase HisIE [Synergistaceae bacterium]|nr:bifunctional phosphoribosyl-AMP cyclohydrolase/phosphoribosyl-ATP diphosphatase HisIE [Synergistaceae bacterium]
MSILDQVHFDSTGLVPVVVQDCESGEVLMVAWANREALEKTELAGELTLFSRSRNCLWKKGETSGNTMHVVEMKIDCDGDTLLALVEPAGPACHTGQRTCFYRSLWGEGGTDCTFWGRLWRCLLERRFAPPEESYTARLLQEGASRIAQKVGEEGVETALAVALKDRENTRYEAADLLYHLLVALISLDLKPLDVLGELRRRHRSTTC